MSGLTCGMVRQWLDKSSIRHYAIMIRCGILTTMQGVTAALVAFFFVCVVFPSLVKNRPQFYAALAAIVLIILLDAVAHMISGKEPGPFAAVAYVFTAILQVGAILLLFLSTGGLTARELAGDMKRAYEVMRRGEEQKSVIIPLTSPLAAQTPSPRSEPNPSIHIIDPDHPER